MTNIGRRAPPRTWFSIILAFQRDDFLPVPDVPKTGFTVALILNPRQLLPYPPKLNRIISTATGEPLLVWAKR